MDSSSLNSDLTLPQSSGKLSKVVGTFLAQFDVKTGYKLVWAKSTVDLDFSSMDYKVLPSGIHEVDKTTILISHKQSGNMYYGIARFHQSVIGEVDPSKSADRDKVKMYSLGILCEANSKGWKPTEFVQNGWEYIDLLDSTLASFIRNQNFDDFIEIEQIYVKLTSTLFPNDTTNIDKHPLNKLNDLLNVLGPLVFVIYKESVLRKRILLFNNGASNVDLLALGSFTYLISLLSIIPKGMESIIRGKGNDYSQPIYTIGLHDLNTDLLQSEGWIGSTNDEVLMYQKEAFDLGVFLPSDVLENTAVFKASDIGHSSLDLNSRIRATIKDYQKFKTIYNILPSSFGTRRSNSSSDEVASIRSSHSFLSFLRTSDPISDWEPSWWLGSATSSMSWREYIWSAFSWFASAGQVASSDDGEIEDSQPSSSDNNSQTLKLNQAVAIVGSFHKLTKKWFYLIDEIVLDRLEEESPHSYDAEYEGDTSMDASLLQSLSSGYKVSIDLTYQDIAEMELDPYSEQDLEFAKSFVLLYWGSVIESVSIGIGIGSICC